MGRAQRAPPPHRVKNFHHPAVGDLSLNFEAMELPADAGLTMTAYSAEPGSASADALKLLASWSVTVGQAVTNDQGPGTVMAPGPQIPDR